MSVYVDELRQYPSIKGKGWRYGKSCHLVADTDAELHAFAERIGMKQHWFQHDSALPHYDLTAARRKLAVKLGAKEISKYVVVAMIRARRAAAEGRVL